MHAPSPHVRGVILLPVNYATILEVYSLEELLELNDITNEECLEYLVDQKFLKLPKITPLDFE